MLNLNFPNFPELETERLFLRQLKADDAGPLHQLRSDPEINRYLDRPISGSVADAQAFIDKINTLVKANQSFYWAITLKPDDGLIGTICFWNLEPENQVIEIGYELMKPYQGKGIITEAAAKVIEFGFTDLNAKTITAFPSADNERSVSLLQRLNFIIDQEDHQTGHEIDNMLKFVLQK